LRIVFDENVPVGVRRFLSKHEVRTFVAMPLRMYAQMGRTDAAARGCRDAYGVTMPEEFRGAIVAPAASARARGGPC
jgi:hypothetical protein